MPKTKQTMPDQRTPRYGLTFTQQWVLATVLATLPLIMAVAYAIYALAAQTQEHGRLLLLMTTLKDLEAEVGRQVTGLERAGLQYLLIGDPRFRELYDQRLKMLQAYQRELVFAVPTSPPLETLDELTHGVVSFKAEFLTSDNSPDDSNANDAWQVVNDKRRQFSEQLNDLTRQSIKESEDRFETVLKRVVFIGVLAVPGTVLLISLSTVTVARPLWRLRDAIRRLGHNQWEDPVRVEGPPDFMALGRSLEWMREQLLTSDQQKQAFLQHITHELKSPLAAIVEAEALLREEIPGKMNESQRQVLSILRHNTQSLRDLIQQLLNYNAVKHNLRPELIEVSVRERCEIFFQRFQPTIDRHRIHWQCNGECDNVQTDLLCLEMITNNLLTNAINLVPENGTVRMSWGVGKNSWWMCVEDNGPGIDPAEVDLLFKPFYQGTAQRRGALKGSGIGLSIVRECVDRLQGSIKVDRSELGGARFTLTFPQI